METSIKLDESEKFLTRHELAQRWRCSRETVKRRQRSGDLHPVRLSKRHLLYKVSEVEALEGTAQ
jgi:DNA-binding GntR family transcriptional regulator